MTVCGFYKLQKIAREYTTKSEIRQWIPKLILDFHEPLLRDLHGEEALVLPHPVIKHHGGFRRFKFIRVDIHIAVIGRIIAVG